MSCARGRSPARRTPTGPDRSGRRLARLRCSHQRRSPRVRRALGVASPRHLGPHRRAPPTMPQLEIDESGDSPAIARDADGIALGGIRYPVVDVPVQVLSGDPGPAPDIICLLTGTTNPIPAERLAELYASRTPTRPPSPRRPTPPSPPVRCSPRIARRCWTRPSRSCSPLTRPTILRHAEADAAPTATVCPIGRRRVGVPAVDIGCEREAAGGG
ncbi:MAG: alpha/beta hydrolase domain-containing protein [Acidimicrobiales bacterium]